MSDETKETEQDKLHKDERSSVSKKGSTSKDKVTISKTDHDKLQDDAKASKGRAEKLSALERERDVLKDRLNSTFSRLDDLERISNESRLAEVRNDPDQLRVYQREQGLTKRERDADTRDADITRREGQIKADREAVDKDRGAVGIVTIATKHGLDPAKLEAYGISDIETLEKIAVDLAAGKPKDAGEGEEGEGEEFTPDEGEEGGEGGSLTTESVGRMSIASVDKSLGKAEVS